MSQGHSDRWYRWTIEDMAVIGLNERKYFELEQLTLQDMCDLNATLNFVVTLCETARQEGLFALERFAKDTEDKFFRDMLWCAIDGLDPETIKELGLRRIVMSGKTGKPLIHDCMILDGILGLLQGNNPFYMRWKMSTWIPGQAFEDDTYQYDKWY